MQLIRTQPGFWKHLEACIPIRGGAAAEEEETNPWRQLAEAYAWQVCAFEKLVTSCSCLTSPAYPVLERNSRMLLQELKLHDLCICMCCCYCAVDTCVRECVFALAQGLVLKAPEA